MQQPLFDFLLNDSDAAFYTGFERGAPRCNCMSRDFIVVAELLKLLTEFGIKFISLEH